MFEYFEQNIGLSVRESRIITPVYIFTFLQIIFFNECIERARIIIRSLCEQGLIDEQNLCLPVEKVQVGQCYPTIVVNHIDARKVEIE